MEKKLIIPEIQCPLHEGLKIQKLDPNPDAKQLFYCIECVLNSNDMNALPSTLLTFDKFTTIAGLHYSTNYHEIEPKSEIPPELVNVLSSKGENLSRLEKCIEKEKKTIEDIFNHLKEVVVDTVSRKKKEYIQMLEERMINACNNYALFEKELKMSYPKAEDLTSLFPSKEELQARLTKLTTASEISVFMKGIIEDMHKRKAKKTQDVEKEERDLAALSEVLNKTEYSKALFDVKDINTYALETSVKESLTNFLKNTLSLFEEKSVKTVYAESSILSLQDWNQIREWLPVKFNFAPKLLYRGTKDGMSSSSFHSKCDEKGPTVTFIKCRFNGSSKTSVIGGFADKDWSQGNKYVPSDESFIFSLTSHVKCEVFSKTSALASVSNRGPCFGVSDIYVGDEAFNECFVKQSSYIDTGKIVECEGYSNPNKCGFTIHKIEIFSIE